MPSVSPLDRAFQFFETAAAVRDQRMQLLSSNIANADTPNYKARDIDFTQSLQSALSEQQSLPAVSLARDNPRHIAGNGPSFAPIAAQYRIPYQESADGNTVEMNTARVNFAETALHEQADLNFVSDRIKTMLSAIQPAT